MKPTADYLPSPEVNAALAEPILTFDRRAAEIVPGEGPKWYLLEVFETAQREVQKELSKRRFGIFVPETEVVEVKRGRKISRRIILFPGYIFVFVWDIERHWSRVMDVPGVIQIMASADGIMTQGLPIACAFGKPFVIPDEKIDDIRRLESGFVHKRRRRGKRQHDDEVIGVYPWSAFPDRLLELDSNGRNQSLRKALGLS
jgi:transcription antitermination factor NusG